MAVMEIVAVHAVLVLDVADDRLDGRTAAHLSLDLRGDAALLLGSEDFELVIGRRIVAAVAGVGVDAFEGVSDELLDRGNDTGESVAVIRIAGQRLGMDSELAAFAMLERGGDAHLDAELIGLVRLALADAFDLGGVQAVDLGAALSALLIADPARQSEQPSEPGLERRVGVDLRQSYRRVAKLALIRYQRYAHAKQFKRANRSLRKLKTYLGRTMRDIGRKIVGDNELHETFVRPLYLAERVLTQNRHQRGRKVYSLHAPEVECIGKGKAHKPYEFGVKVSVATTLQHSRGGQFVAHVVALPDNPMTATPWRP